MRCQETGRFHGAGGALVHEHLNYLKEYLRSSLHQATPTKQRKKKRYQIFFDLNYTIISLVLGEVGFSNRKTVTGTHLPT